MITAGANRSHSNWRPCPLLLPCLFSRNRVRVQFHDGLGFLTNHIMLTNTFEYSLQRVNPKLTVPYWDFTVETSTSNGLDADTPEPQSYSPMFTSEYFGSADPEDHQVRVLLGSETTF